MSKFSFNADGSVIILDADITNRITVHARVVLDTGASLVVLPWRMITSLNIRIDPHSLVSTSTATTVESAPFVILPKMTVLDMTVKNVPCLVKDLPAESGVDGLLGLSFLRHFRIMIDFVHGKLTLNR